MLRGNIQLRPGVGQITRAGASAERLLSLLSISKWSLALYRAKSSSLLKRRSRTLSSQSVPLSQYSSLQSSSRLFSHFELPSLGGIQSSSSLHDGCLSVHRPHLDILVFVLGASPCSWSTGFVDLLHEAQPRN